MRPRPLLAVLAVLALSLGACGDGGGGTADEASPTAGATGERASAVELEDGVAAVVNGDEIPADLLASRVEMAARSPQVAGILEGDDGEAARAQLRASILSQLIVNEIVLDGADERGIEIDDAAVATTRDELTAQAGGEEAFDTQVSEAGLDDEQLAAELRAITALRLVRDDLAAEEDGASPAPVPTGPDGSTPDPRDVRLQQWLLERLQSAEIVVAPEIGSWDPTQGAVVPPAVAAVPGGDGSTPAPTTDAPPSPSASPTAG